MLRAARVFGLCYFAGGAGIALAQPAPPETVETSDLSATFSVVAVDPQTGVCGAAVASKFPAVGKVVPYVQADVGAFCTQHYHEPTFGPRALELLAAGKHPADVLAELVRKDEGRDGRQLAIVDLLGRTAVLHPTSARPTSQYWGALSGRYYAVQGNTLAGRQVIVAMAAAYEETEGSLADRIMAALLAGDCAGGDHRGRLAAGIRVCRSGTEGYWLELYVDRSEDAVAELFREYAKLEHEARGEWISGSATSDDVCSHLPEAARRAISLATE